MLASPTTIRAVETIFRWSKFVDEDQVDAWETRLLLAEIPYVVEMAVKRRRRLLSSYTTSSVEAEALKTRFGGKVESLAPEVWQPASPAVAPPPLRIRDALLVTTADDPAEITRLEQAHPGRIVLSFPPQLAFGTGGHATTAGCLRFLVDIAKRRRDLPWKVVDLGCGSGILAIAAAKLGASSVVALENDAMALGYARENAERHGIADRIRFLEADAVAWTADPASGVFDLIAANLFSDLLETLFPLFPRRLATRGELIVSGFLATQAESVTRAATDAGLPPTETIRRGKWMAARIAGGASA